MVIQRHHDWAKKVAEILKKSSRAVSRNIDKISIVNTYFHNNEKPTIQATLLEPLDDGVKQGVKIDIEYQTPEGRKRTPFSLVIHQVGRLNEYFKALKQADSRALRGSVAKILIPLALHFVPPSALKKAKVRYIDKFWAVFEEKYYIPRDLTIAIMREDIPQYSKPHMWHIISEIGGIEAVRNQYYLDEKLLKLLKYIRSDILLMPMKFQKEAIKTFETALKEYTAQ